MSADNAFAREYFGLPGKEKEKHLFEDDIANGMYRKVADEMISGKPGAKKSALTGGTPEATQILYNMLATKYLRPTKGSEPIGYVVIENTKQSAMLASKLGYNLEALGLDAKLI
jgi:hypothetical protein